MNPKLHFIPLREEHISPLTAIMIRAFDDDAVRYQGCEHARPEGYDDGSFLRKWGLEYEMQIYRNKANLFAFVKL